MSIDVCVLVPMLGRAHMVDPLAESLAASTDRARIMWLCTAGDTDVIDACHGLGEIVLSPRRKIGDYAAKINLGAASCTEPLLFTGAIDLRFYRGWLEAAEAKLVGPVQVVGTNDMGNPRVMCGQHSTHTLMTADYATRPCIDGSPGPLFVGYPHEFVDDEFVATARRRGVYAHAHNARVEHLHWAWGKRPRDNVDGGYARRYRESARIFRGRRRLWA